MKVILTVAAGPRGKIGDVIEVSEGYARNFLLPQGMAVEATATNIARLNSQSASLRKREEKARKDAGVLAQAVSGKTFVITKKVGREGKLFGSVTSKDIQEAMGEHGLAFDRKSIGIDEPIRSLGEFSVRIKLPKAGDVRVNIMVKAEE